MKEPIETEVVSIPSDVQKAIDAIEAALQRFGYIDLQHFGDYFYSLTHSLTLTKSGITELRKGKQHKPSRYHY